MAKPYSLLRAQMSAEAQRKAVARSRAMTLQDLIEYMRDEVERQTLTEQAITRCLLLAFDLGMAAGEARMSPSAPVIPAEAEVQESPAQVRQGGEDTP